jgi:hypothetical protein
VKSSLLCRLTCQPACITRMPIVCLGGVIKQWTAAYGWLGTQDAGRLEHVIYLSAAGMPLAAASWSLCRRNRAAVQGMASTPSISDRFCRVAIRKICVSVNSWYPNHALEWCFQLLVVTCLAASACSPQATGQAMKLWQWPPAVSAAHLVWQLASKPT